MPPTAPPEHAEPVPLASAPPAARRSPPRWLLSLPVAVALIAAGAAGCYGLMRWLGVAPAAASESEKPSAPPTPEGVVRLSATKCEAAGVRCEPAASAPFVERVWRSGRLTLNEGRVAHVSPLVEGVVREVRVRLGQDVKAGEVLAVIDSREVGSAKLELVKARLALDSAKAQHDWTLTVSRNAAEMVDAMNGDAPVAEVERRFKDRPIGDLRQQLVTAYSRRLQAKSLLDAAGRPGAAGAMPESAVVRLRSDFEAAEAADKALAEEAKFQTAHQARMAEQKLREAQTAEALGKTQLFMLGYSREEVESLDPLTEGPRVSHYPVRAPFAGTVIEQHAVPAERVGPQAEMFRLADLSTVWLQADVPQKDLPLVRGLAGGKVRFRLTEEAGTVREADVFYTGDVVDRQTRAVALTATVPNPDRSLKPGMFVEVELTRPAGEAVQVPASAVLRQHTQPFVFVRGEGDEFRRVDVKLGRESGERVEVLDGLKPGAPVVVEGAFVLKSELMRDQMMGE